MTSSAQKILRTGAVVLFGTVFALCTVLDVSAQGTRRKRVPAPQPVAATSTQAGEAQIISRAEDYPDNGLVRIPKTEDRKTDSVLQDPTESSKAIDELKARVAGLESSKKTDKDEKQKRLLLNLDILNRAEQRSESLRKQLFEMIERESTIKTKLDIIETNIRPEAIEREVAFAGTLRPEALRDLKKKQLEIERTNLQAVLAEVQRTKTTLDTNLRRSEDMVEKLRLKFEKEIDDALADDQK